MINYTFKPRNADTLKNLEAARLEMRAANFGCVGHARMPFRGFDVYIGLASDSIRVRPDYSGFCSTLRNIEGLYNLEQFELYHARACQVLRICEKHHLLEEVIDRSGWWETQNLDYLRAAGKSELSLMTLLAGSDNPMAQAMLKIAQAEH